MQRSIGVSIITSLIVSGIVFVILWLSLRSQIAHVSQEVFGTIDSQNTVLQQKLNDNLAKVQSAIIDNIQEAGKSVVSVIASKNVKFYFAQPGQNIPGAIEEKSIKVGGGSGIFVSKSGYVLTNKHVVQDTSTSYTVIGYDDTLYTVDNVWLDPVLDIAVLQVRPQGSSSLAITPASILPFAEEVQVGQFALAIGNALGELENSVTFGIISAKDRKLVNLRDNVYAGLLQTDTPMNPGNSGGPLLDIYGRVIGINTAIALDGQNVGFALPITQEFVAATLESVVQYNAIYRPYLGISFVDITVQVQQELDLQVHEGIYVQDVVNNSPAQVGGLRAGDIIVSLDGRKINNSNPFLYQLYSHTPGDTIRIQVLRSGDPKEVIIQLGSSGDL